MPQRSANKLRNLQAPSVAAQLVSQAQSAQSENRLMLLRQLSSLKFLLRHIMAIRGHKKGEGNLVQLMDLRSEDVPGIKRWFEKHQYMSHQVVNEMITLMGNTILRKLLSNIHEVCWFTVIADEMRDISNHEQLGIAIHWVGSTYDIHEYFIGLVHVPTTTSATLTVAIKDILIRCIFPLNNCLGQAYDGASNMIGYLRGVATRIQEEQPSAIKVHCLAHCLNLCLQSVARKCQPIRNAFDVTMELEINIVFPKTLPYISTV